MTGVQIVILVLCIILLGVVVFPLINRRQFKNLPNEQKVRILMKEANSLTYFKNLTQGNHGVLYYVKNKRKILYLDWKLVDGKMVCTRKNPLSKWDYPEEQEAINDDEKKQFFEALETFNKKSPVKFVFPNL